MPLVMWPFLGPIRFSSHNIKIYVDWSDLVLYSFHIDSNKELAETHAHCNETKRVD